ncbi:hypothetical protein AGMMS50212_12230 [Spirochaetia bacterium]|nr:hypothetical protein AGMMS50212_12230 [Spirochaetia bacterium]
MKKNFVKTVLLCAILTIVLSCASTVPLKIEHPAVMDTTGIEKLTVIPFEDAYFQKERGLLHGALYSMFRNREEKLQDEERKTAITLTRNFILTAKDIKTWEFINPYKLAKTDKENYLENVDAYITGKIEKFYVDDVETRIESAGLSLDTNITRTVELVWSYSLVRASDETVIATAQKSGKEKQSFRSDNDAEFSPSSLAGIIIRREYKAMLHDFMPWTENTKQKLAQDKTGDPRMKEAQKLSASKKYADALSIYNTVYAETGNFAAAYNEAILTEVQGDVPKALALMEAIDGTPLDKKDKALLSQEIDRLKNRDREIKLVEERAAIKLK